MSEEVETLDGVKPSQELILRASEELIKQEQHIQGLLVGLFPLMAFSKLEPDIATHFRGDVYKKIAINAQLLLDRMRESRVMLGYVHDGNKTGVSEAIGVFTTLAPYRVSESSGHFQHGLMCDCSASISES